MAKLTSKQLEASTLIEVLIAMVIIMVVFSMAMGLFSNVLSSGVSMRKVQIGQQLETLRLQVIKSGSVEQEISNWIVSITKSLRLNRPLQPCKW